MKTEVILTIMNRPLETETRPPAAMGMILGIKQPRWPVVPERVVKATRATRSDSSANPDPSAKFREDIRRRYETPFHSVWHSEGINLNEAAD